MPDSLLRPTFPEAEVKKALAERIEGAKALKDEPSAAAAAYFQAFFFGRSIRTRTAPRATRSASPASAAPISRRIIPGCTRVAT